MAKLIGHHFRADFHCRAWYCLIKQFIIIFIFIFHFTYRSTRSFAGESEFKYTLGISLNCKKEKRRESKLLCNHSDESFDVPFFNLFTLLLIIFMMMMMMNEREANSLITYSINKIFQWLSKFYGHSFVINFFIFEIIYIT